MHRSCLTNPTARGPATSRRARRRRRPGTETSGARPRHSLTGPRKRGTGLPTPAKHENPLLVEETFRTGTQSHTSLEPHATVARFDGDRLTVHVSTQSVFHVMELIAKRYKLEHDKVRVIADHVGGGFGSKGTIGIETTVAIDLAREAKAPVRIAYDRHEELSVTGYRPATEIELALFAVRARRSQSAVAHGPCRHRRCRELDARRSRPADLSGGSQGARRLRRPSATCRPARPFRGPGGPPMAFCAGTGDRRSRVADQGRSDSFAQNAGIPIPIASGFTIGHPDWRSGAA